MEEEHRVGFGHAVLVLWGGLGDEFGGGRLGDDQEGVVDGCHVDEEHCGGGEEVPDDFEAVVGVAVEGGVEEGACVLAVGCQLV